MDQFKSTFYFAIFKRCFKNFISVTTKLPRLFLFDRVVIINFVPNFFNLGKSETTHFGLRKIARPSKQGQRNGFVHPEKPFAALRKFEGLLGFKNQYEQTIFL